MEFSTLEARIRNTEENIKKCEEQLMRYEQRVQLGSLELEAAGVDLSNLLSARQKALNKDDFDLVWRINHHMELLRNIEKCYQKLPILRQKLRQYTERLPEQTDGEGARA